MERSVWLATSLTCATQRPRASVLASIGCELVRAHVAEQSAIQSTCCSMVGSMLVSTDGLPGPVIVNRLGKPATARPR